MASDFDPLALVKAMGPQRDPYSWAELYSQDAAKQDMLKQQIAARLLMADNAAAERAAVRADTRASIEDIAEKNRNNQMAMLKYRIENSPSLTQKNFTFPPGVMTDQEYNQGNISGKLKGKYNLIIVGGKPYRVPANGPAIQLPKGGVPKSKYEDDNEED